MRENLLGECGVMLQKEMPFISDLLDSRGLREEDEIVLSPLFGRKRSFKLMRSKIDFLTQNLVRTKSCGYHKVLDSLEKEKLHYQLRLVKTLGRNKSIKQRYQLTTIEGSPFKHNGNFVNEAFLERGDYLEMGHNNMEVKQGVEREEKMLPMDAESEKIIQSDLPILINGETGTGKTTLAKKIHSLSREGLPFIHLNLSAFSSNLLESELFGHVKGAFTGAINDKAGAFREAGNGTLFLDEIDSLPIEVQTKLLIFLDEFKIRSVGSSSEHKVGCRLICASGTCLKEMVKKGKMRRDFFYRIASGLRVDLPSMRYDENLIERLSMSFSLDHKVVISENLLDFYKTLPWPGNVRQFYGHLKKKIIYSGSSKLDYDRYDEELAMESSDLAQLNFDKDDGFFTLEEMKYEYVKNMFFRCG